MVIIGFFYCVSRQRFNAVRFVSTDNRRVVSSVRAKTPRSPFFNARRRHRRRRRCRRRPPLKQSPPLRPVRIYTRWRRRFSPTLPRSVELYVDGGVPAMDI